MTAFFLLTIGSNTFSKISNATDQLVGTAKSEGLPVAFFKERLKFSNCSDRFAFFTPVNSNAICFSYTDLIKNVLPTRRLP